MADDQLRNLARRYRETGDPADEAAWLRERVRSGELASDRLELAAYLGHQPAHLAGAAARAPTWAAIHTEQLTRIKDPGKATLLTRKQFATRWLQAAGPPSREVLTRIALAPARLMLERTPEHDPLVAAAVTAAADWADDPREDSEEARLASVRAGDAATQARGSLTESRTWAWYLLDVAASAAYTAGSLTRTDAAEYAARGIRHAGAALGEQDAEGLPPQVEARIQAELIPWALGTAGG